MALNNADAILAETRLDSGMSAREATARARNWWDCGGRRLITLAATDEVLRARSSMLRGEPFDSLEPREQIKVVRAWHHFCIRRGSILDIAADAPYVLGPHGEVVE